MRFLIEIVTALAIGAFAQSFSLHTTASRSAALNLVGSDRIVCAVNPDAITVGAGRTIIDQTLPANKTFNGTLTASGTYQ